MATNLVNDKFWVDKCVYHDAERKFHESLAKLHKNGQKCEEVGKNGQKCDEVNNRKPKENKSGRAQMKNQKNSENAEAHIGKKESSSVEEKNAKNTAFSMVHYNVDSLKMGQKNIDPKQDDIISEREESLKDSEKKMKQKDVKEKKNKTEKKSKKNRDKEENKAGGVGMANVSQESFPKTSLAGEVAKARQHIKSSLESMDGLTLSTNLASENARLTSIVDRLEAKICSLEKRVEILEKKCSTCPPANTSVGHCQTAAKKTSVGQSQTVAAKTSEGQSQTKPVKDEDDDVDLFGSESEEEDEDSKKIREQRLAEYNAKKSKKPVLIAKSNIILDVKPWDDETDMKKMETEVRAIKMEGLIWGASKLVPLAYGIHKLQISCVVEDDKVSVDSLTEVIEAIEDYVQSVDIAAFNKV